MARFDDCLKFVLEREGGFVNDPADSGGATNKGVTQRVYDTWRRARAEPERSVRDIEDAEVRAIYHENYWVAASCPELPEPIDLLHFDTAVNLGPGTAARMLQTALNMSIVDGIVGHRTLANARANDALTTCARYSNLRVTRYIVIAAGSPEKRKFLRGWLRRVGALLQEL